MDNIVSLCKRRGFIFPGSDIYGGFAGTWDFGPLGVMLKKNLMDTWWHYWVESRDDIFGIDAAIIMNPALGSPLATSALSPTPSSNVKLATAASAPTNSPKVSTNPSPTTNS